MVDIAPAAGHYENSIRYFSEKLRVITIILAFCKRW
ncbi:hypothetical protein HNQ63_001002 [Wenzhouxiangella marina]|uniref:Uncharacterized protein n=1 Tax=Wenzhouxiangella marina TaxID=1579979 RepID=A0A0K0XVD8_9GAMM|nr:hypothetical protein WM2015_1301 [Wenzhouxiangella marina]MBB6086565.1 hypothetical protein [Wenzhouxiangella marina]